ncbi:hypothetical protein GC089_18205 [Cellulomonas sp. JZ18]|uniref:hypothetical protein n=1 Tax=Cellulomonas sp. JZ18 TaxID=2654191 RepID=UPI0012D3B94F|nr:hypothetical protein [Cellulomonas sp. JZ18]QGQ20771.1 hypothetical protein GC089_18205 [Cellulomonas sp. JZ18]
MDRDERDEVDLVAELREAVERRVPDDVMVEETDDGFAVGFRHPFEDGIGSTRGWVRSWSMVRCDPTTMTLRIVDMSLSAEVNRFTGSVSASGRTGREKYRRWVEVYERGPDGRMVLVGREEQRSSTLHDAIRGPARELGWQEKQPASAIAGLVAAAVAGGGLVIGGVFVAVMALTGRIG